MAMESARNEWSYPETSVTLFRTLREARSGVDDAAWARFVDMYGPVIHHLVRLLSPGISDADTDEAVQDVFVKLVDILRSGAYDPSKSRSAHIFPRFRDGFSSTVTARPRGGRAARWGLTPPRTSRSRAIRGSGWMRSGASRAAWRPSGA